MPTPFPSELLTAFRAMAEIVYSGESYDSVYEAVCSTAVQLVDGCDHASLMLRRGGRIDTVAASDQVAQRIDGPALREAQQRKDAVAAYELVYAALGAPAPTRP